MKRLLAIVTATALSLGISGALAQSTDTAKTDADKAVTKPTGKEAMQQQMDLQKNKPSKAVSEKEKASPKYRPGGQAGMESQMELQKNKPSKKVKNDTAKIEPKPDASKMTPEERAKYREEVVKGAKP